MPGLGDTKIKHADFLAGAQSLVGKQGKQYWLEILTEPC